MAHTIESAITAPKAALFLQKIKTSTAEYHLKLESQALLFAIMTPSVTHFQYYYYLLCMQKIHELYEQEIVTRLANIVCWVEHRKASQLISDDLDNIELSTPNNLVKEYANLGEEVSIPFALGFMYVMEGSKLGGKVIYKHIHRTLGYTEDYGAKFIADHGNNTFSLWKQFLAQFSGYVIQHDCEEEAILGAKYAFGSINDFFESNRLVYEI